MKDSKPAAETWCSDTLHNILGCSDTALAGYLTSVASSVSSHHKILSILHEGEVQPIHAKSEKDKERILKEFALELFQRCHPNYSSSSKAENSKARKRSKLDTASLEKKSNADWIKKAGNYDLIADDNENNERGEYSVKTQSVSLSTSTKNTEIKPVQEIEIKSRSDKSRKKSRKDHNVDFNEKTNDNDDNASNGHERSKDSKRRSRRRRRRRRAELSSSSSEEDNNDFVDIRRKYDTEVEQRRVERYEKKSRISNNVSPTNSDNEIDEKEVTEEKEEEPEERAERERQQDLKERDEFAKRLLERDQRKTKSGKDNDNNNDKQENLAKRLEMEKRLARGETVIDEGTGSSINLKNLREESRRAYLKQRTERELKLLERELADEEEMFDQEKLTDKERKRIELRKQILEMARDDKIKKNRSENDGFYRLPDEYEEQEGRTKAEKDNALLKSRYVEEKVEKSEQQLWEESQVQKATVSGMRSKKGKEKDEKEYDFVFEDQIDFVMTDKRKGYDERDKKKRRSRKRSESESSSMSSDNESEKNLVVKSLTAHEKLLEGRKKLPVFPYREEFLSAVKDHQVLILVGETGSGKTTQIPQYLHEIGYSELGKIGCTQPRRVAAMSVATRVATEMNVKVGHEVGYSIRFENCTSKKTVIQYMTDGMLLREFLTEPDLGSYSCLIIDEAHERTLHTDILFGLIKDIVRFRNDLKLIISSATLDAEKFSKYFDDASIFMIPGRMFPVDIYYTKNPEADYVDASVVTVLQIHISQPLDGDVLVFLTGQEEIETAAEILTQRAQALGSRIPELIVCPIFANLPSEQQAKIFEKTPKGARKVVLATNIAETSLTIDGICYVIDTGFNKQNSYDARSGMESLTVTPISRAASNQRAGRAGRTQPGKCFRLFTSFSFNNELDANTIPEIMRTNMCNVVLMLKSLGINDLINFDFMDAPPADTLIRALEQLYALGALNDCGELTKLGRRMAEFPLDPMLSKSVIAAEKYKCVKEVLSTVSMLSIGSSVFYRPKEKAIHADTARMNFARGGGGDHIALQRCYTEWAETDYSVQWCFENFVQVRNMRKARDIRDQLEGLCERVEIDQELSSPDDQEAVLKAIASGFFYNTAKLGKSGDYITVKQRRTVYIHPSSVLAKEEELPGWLVYFELAFTTKEFMRQVAPIQPGWLVEIAPHFYQDSEVQDSSVKKMPKNVKKR